MIHQVLRSECVEGDIEIEVFWARLASFGHLGLNGFKSP